MTNLAMHESQAKGVDTITVTRCAWCGKIKLDAAGIRFLDAAGVKRTAEEWQAVDVDVVAHVVSDTCCPSCFSRVAPGRDYPG